MKSWAVVILCFWTGIAQGQARLIDSLQQLADREGSTPKKVTLLNQLSFAYFDTDVEKAGQFSLQALQLSRKIVDPAGEGWAIAYQGVYLLLKGMLPGAQRHFEIASASGRRLGDHSLEAYALIQSGNTFRDKGVFDSAYFFYRQADVVVRNNPDPYYESVIRMNRGRYYLILSKPDSALLEVRTAMKLREASSHGRSMADVWILMAHCHRALFDHQEAERYLNLAIKDSPDVPAIRADYLFNMGEIYFRQGDFPKAVDNWEKVLGDPSWVTYQYRLASLLVRMGEVFEEQGYYDLAMESLARSLQVSEKAPFKYLVGEAYYEIAWVAYRAKNLDMAMKNIQKSEKVFSEVKQELQLSGTLNVKGLIQMKKGSYDSSLYYHLRALRQRERLGNKVAISSSVFNIGQLYSERKEYKRAISYFWRSSRIDASINDTYGKSLNYYQLGMNYNMLGNYDSAGFYLRNAIQFAIPNSATEILKNSYGEMASYLQNIGRPKEAIDYYKKYILVSDSIYNKQSSQSMAAYNSLYEVGKKQKEIELLNKDNLLVRARAERQSTLFYVAIGSLAVLVVIITFYYRFTKRLKRLNEEIKAQSGKLTATNAVLSDLNNELERSNRQLTGAMADLRKTQEQLIQSEKMASLGLLSSGVAHELNNPLNFIKGGVNALGEQLKDIDSSRQTEVKTFIDIINEGVNRSSAIIRGLSQYSRQSEEQNEVCDVNRILDNCLVILNNKLKYRVTVEKEFQEPFLLSGNEGKLHQAFINILTNAEQAIEGNGVIRVTTQEADGRKRITIEDTGCGIPKENLPRLGDPFFTTKAPGQGTGLGLSITYKIIQGHGGSISVTSEPGVGTKFVVSFP